MLDAATFFGKFKGRGLLQSVTWIPASGSLGATFEARLMKGGGGLALIGADEHAVQFVANDAPGIAQGDMVTIGDRTFKVRDRDEPNCSADGTLLAFRVREVIA